MTSLETQSPTHSTDDGNFELRIDSEWGTVVGFRQTRQFFRPPDAVLTGNGQFVMQRSTLRYLPCAITSRIPKRH